MLRANGYPNLILEYLDDYRYRIDIPRSNSSTQSTPKLLHLNLKFNGSLKESLSSQSRTVLIKKIAKELSLGLPTISLGRTATIFINTQEETSPTNNVNNNEGKELDIWTIEIGESSREDHIIIAQVNAITAYNVTLTIVGKGGHSSLKPLTINPVLPVCEFRVAAEQIFRTEFEEYADQTLFMSFPKITTSEIKNVIPDSSSLSGVIQSQDDDIQATLCNRLHETAIKIGSKRNVLIKLAVEPRQQESSQSSILKTRLEELTGALITFEQEKPARPIKMESSITGSKFKGLAKISTCLDNPQDITGHGKTAQMIAGLILHQIESD
jgi:hypothetical protein